MPSSGSSDSTTSDADSGLSDVEELLDAVGQALTASDYQQSPTREQEASEALNLSFSEDQYFSMSTATKEYETSRFSTQSLGGGGGAPGVDRPGGALRKSHFIDHQAELTAKLDPRDVRLTTPDGFPVRIYRSTYLRQALERFTLKPKVERALRKLVRLPEMKKAFLYIFWIYFAMRFRDGSFAVLDHAMASAATAHCLDVDIGVQERRRIIEQDLEVAHQRRVKFIKQWRAKFQHYFMTLRREQPRLMPYKVQEVIPFVLGTAITLAFEDTIRFGHEVLTYKDPNAAQLYQVIFMETVGFKVDRVYVTRFLKRKVLRAAPIKASVEAFFRDRKNYLQSQALRQYRHSKDPAERLEYQLDQMIGPSRMKETMKKAQELARPNSSNLALLLEEDVFTSDIMDEVCLFPRPLNKFQRVAEQNELTVGRTKDVSRSRMATEGSILEQTTDASALNTSQTLQSALPRSVSQSQLHASRLSQPKQRSIVYRQGGNHAHREALMVLESDRTSPMMRSVQSQAYLHSHRLMTHLGDLRESTLPDAQASTQIE